MGGASHAAEVRMQEPRGTVEARRRREPWLPAHHSAKILDGLCYSEHERSFPHTVLLQASALPHHPLLRGFPMEGLPSWTPVVHQCRTLGVISDFSFSLVHTFNWSPSSIDSVIIKSYLLLADSFQRLLSPHSSLRSACLHPIGTNHKLPCL